MTALMVACEFGCAEACRALLEIPGIDVNVLTEEGVCFGVINRQRISVKHQGQTNAWNLSGRA
jgi:ankyrin repeat protein